MTGAGAVFCGCGGLVAAPDSDNGNVDFSVVEAGACSSEGLLQLNADLGELLFCDAPLLSVEKGLVAAIEAGAIGTSVDRGCEKTGFVVKGLMEAVPLTTGAASDADGVLADLVKKSALKVGAGFADLKTDFAGSIIAVVVGVTSAEEDDCVGAAEAPKS